MGKILTCDQLPRRGFTLANGCHHCHEDEETADHLFLHCVKIRPLWELLISLFGVLWVNPKSIRET